MMDPVTVFATLECSEPDIAPVKGAASELARQSIRQAGCLRTDVRQSRKGMFRLIIHEV